MYFRALSRLVPDPDAFRQAPPRVPMVWRMPAAPLTGLLSLNDVDRLLGDGVLRQGMVRVVQDGQIVPPRRYTYADRPIESAFAEVVRAEAIGELLRQGATVVFDALYRTWRPVGDVCRRLGHEAGIPVRAGAYLTPAGSQGFAHHYDPVSVLIVQTEGSKRWQVHEPVVPDPSVRRPWRPEALDDTDWDRLRNGVPTLETTLRAGDVLWIPRGWVHNAFALDEPSLHITFDFGLHTPQSIAENLVRRLDASAEMRRELPWGLAQRPELLAEVVDEVIGQLTGALEAVDRTAFVEELTKTMRRTFPEPVRAPVGSGLMGQVGPDTPLVTVTEAVSGVDRLPDGGARLHLADDVIALDASQTRAFIPRWEADCALPWRALDLMPELDEGGSVRLVSKLLRAGVVRPHT
ncbi:JmjC domain-containing protein [Wenjunlia tyrosinilytica]|uniref:JmjC domain-containing protein n=1 Tax=Wenjunlia tyrosinilytica TaxID=1544741 RepID=A0A917ZXR7_9ACTN|nr:cupin domain-containing protein [Wenjunlia tyrosinilytica]GGP00009.1 hypothetical protein GCM10012280_67760 [Wenjunlia tyrosinilytica]